MNMITEEELSLAVRDLEIENATLLKRVRLLQKAVKRAAWDFETLITRGDLADEPRAKQTLQILRSALSTKPEAKPPKT